MPLPNFVEGPNPFRLPSPSPQWLQLLSDYDDQLLIIPSQREYAYRLYRRVRPEARLGLNKTVVHTHPDTVLMIQHGAVPVTTLTHWSVQGDVGKVIRDLMARDSWMLGGAKVIVDEMEYQEEMKEKRRKRAQSENGTYVGREAFRGLQSRTGAKVSIADVNRGRHRQAGVNRVGRIHTPRERFGLD
jgi:hypothetical protein